jgi:sporulation-control protein spo0M
MLRDRLLAPVPFQDPGIAPHALELKIETDRRELRLGETVVGSVTVIAGGQQVVRGVRLEFLTVTDDSGVDDEVRGQAQLIGQCELAPGEPLTMPFQLTIPADAPICWQAEHNSLHWYLRAIVDVPMGVDKTARLELILW